MQIIRQRAYARAGLMGNPSDGYQGKTVSLIVRNFWAEVVLYEWDQLEIVLTDEDRNKFNSLNELVRDVELHGYYGGIRLIKATIKRFTEYCRQQDWPLDDRNFSIRYHTTIPRLVGLAGSSAIIVATLRALMDFFRVPIPLEVQPSLALAVENAELGIPGGLQDRVIQVYEGLVYMDFSEERERRIDGLVCGMYERLAPELLPPLYVAYKADASNPTEVFHNNLRQRYNQGDLDVVAAMKTFARLADEAREALRKGDADWLARLVNLNFDTRRQICQLPREQVEMIEVARRVGASAKFAGSGGAIIGTYRDETMYGDLVRALSRIGCRVTKPQVVPAT